MATEAERKLFASKVLAAVGREPSSLRGERRKLSGFMAMAGSLYAGDLMVVGRACNGWGAEDEMKLWGRPCVQGLLRTTCS